MKSPGVLAGVGWNGPRILLGASGLRSNVSSWLGPPKSVRKMTDLARGRPVAVVVSAASNRGSDSPNSPAPAASSKFRRDRPSAPVDGTTFSTKQPPDVENLSRQLPPRYQLTFMR